MTYWDNNAKTMGRTELWNSYADLEKAANNYEQQRADEYKLFATHPKTRLLRYEAKITHKRRNTNNWGREEFHLNLPLKIFSDNSENVSGWKRDGR